MEYPRLRSAAGVAVCALIGDVVLSGVSLNIGMEARRWLAARRPSTRVDPHDNSTVCVTLWAHVAGGICRLAVYRWLLRRFSSGHWRRALLDSVRWPLLTDVLLGCAAHGALAVFHHSWMQRVRSRSQEAVNDTDSQSWRASLSLSARCALRALSEAPKQQAHELFLVTLLLPLVEETFYRGCLLHDLHTPLGASGAVLLQALWFAANHSDHFLLRTARAALYGLLYLRSNRNLIVPLLVHALNNVLAWGLTMAAQQHKRNERARSSEVTPSD